jgi:hypothetical protein
MRVTLKHEIEIAASPKNTYSFFENIGRNYTKWHPDHVSFRWVTGNFLAPGATACFTHRIEGTVHELPAQFTGLIAGQRIEYEWQNASGGFSAPRNVWIFKATDRGCLFVSESELLLENVSSLSKQVEAALTGVQRHLAEEGENLKTIVESAGVK